MLAAAMMLDGADIQNHPVRDLVTPRNPRSRYTFVNFLHEQVRLFKHLNLPVDRPLRKEYARYIQWVAETVPADVDYGRNVTAIRLAGSGAEVRTTDGSSYLGRAVVVAPGRSPYLPTVFGGVPFPRAVHTSRFLPGIADLDRDWAGTLAVVGASQSAIGVMLDLSTWFPAARIVNVMSGYGYRLKDTSPFSEEVYFPEFVDYPVRRYWAFALPGEVPPAFRFPAGRAELRHQSRDGVLPDLPPGRVQTEGDPRRAVGATRGVKDLPDLHGELGPALLTNGGLAAAPLVEPGIGQSERAAGHRVRHTVVGPLGTDEGCHGYFIASFTHRTTERLRTSRSIASSAFSRRSRSKSARSDSDTPPLDGSRRSMSLFTQFARVPSLAPRSRATCATGLFVSCTIRAAPARNSGSNRRLVSAITIYPFRSGLHATRGRITAAPHRAGAPDAVVPSATAWPGRQRLRHEPTAAGPTRPTPSPSSARLSPGTGVNIAENLSRARVRPGSAVVSCPTVSNSARPARPTSIRAGTPANEGVP
ncbi:SidA/IucD/PvdA family monooxygenase [Micromonospora sp. KC213]|uniref:SidA/IucD/PvdA family monooxygenase n=1 Tax=Micromonospora sp. KC213 TaxID=2530378 RepID=UPI00104B0627|nr:SidA/IucD/PvdA family monooxygenase [Micromonospora sp. KC213]TDC36987.1 hypothetical protein E1166_21115 [Micromonospora sp. KC213]